MNKREIDILMDKYILGSLTKDEEKNLLQEIKNNPDLENEIKARKNIVLGVKYAGNLQLKEVLTKIHLEESGQNTTSDKRNNKYYIIGGLLIVALTALYFMLRNNAPAESNNNLIYAEFYEKYNSSLLDRGISAEEAISAFHNSYTKGNYQEALKTITPFLEESDNEVKLIAALAANEIDDIPLAEQLLTTIIESNDFYFKDHATWYKALIKLRQHDYPSTKKLLSKIASNPKADHYEEAKELLNELNETE